MTRRRAPAIPLGATIGLAWRLTAGRLGRWLVLTMLVQGVVLLAAAPLLVGLFQGVLAAAGLASLTSTNAVELVARPGALALLVALLLLAVVALVAQTSVIAIAADGQQATGAVPGARALLGRLGRRARGLARPSTLLLLPYLLLLVPLGHAAFGSVITRWIAIPDFISGELAKTPAGAVAWAGITIAIWYVNIRLLLTIPFLAVGGMTAPQAFRASWAATRWRLWRLVVIALAVTVPAAVAALVLAGLALGATAIADAGAPDAAPIVAAVALAVAQLGAFVVIGLALAIQLQALVRIVRLALAAWSGEPAPARPVSARERAGRGWRWAAGGVGAAAAAAVVALAAAAVPILNRVDDGSTLVIAHRGDVAHAVENTIPALEAANAAGADVVEFDVQQTKDGDWVVMHDFDLTRLTGSPGAVKDMTLAEATALTVRQNGFEARVPSMREWVHRAKELGQPLLIEIKPHGGETADYLETFYRILDEEGVTDSELYHSLSEAVVDGQLAQRPETTVGLIVPISVGGGVPTTEADFVVVEAFSYSEAMLAALHDEGRGLVVWTVDDEASMRRFLRDGVDGIVTDEIALLMAQRADLADEHGLVPKLLDALDRAVTLW